MSRWSRHSFVVFFKIFILCFISGSAIAFTFDFASESDEWLKVSSHEVIFRGLSLVLYLMPISIWVALLITLMRWHLTNELKLLQAYAVSRYQACKGVGVGLFLVIIAWFILKETIWVQFVKDELTESKAVLFQLEEGTALIESSEEGKGYASVWFEIENVDAVYTNLFFIKGEWKLKEDIRLNNAALKKKLEGVLNKEFPKERDLTHHFISSSSLNLMDIAELEQSNLWLGYRLLLPVFSFLCLFAVAMSLIYLKRNQVWKWWSFSFFSFIMIVSFFESSFT